MAFYMINENAPNGIAAYSGGDTQPSGGGLWISGPATNDISLMIYDGGQVRLKNQAELEDEVQTAAEREAARAEAQAALEAVSPDSLNQLAEGFTTLLDSEAGLSTDTKTALADLITEAVGCIGHLRDLVVLSLGGEIE